MNEYRLAFDDGSSAYLAHHGVKGMKWGVQNEETKRRYQAQKKTIVKKAKKVLAENVTYDVAKAAGKRAASFTARVAANATITPIAVQTGKALMANAMGNPVVVSAMANPGASIAIGSAAAAGLVVAGKKIYDTSKKRKGK